MAGLSHGCFINGMKPKLRVPKALPKAGSAVREGTAAHGVNKCSVGKLQRPHSSSRARQKRLRGKRFWFPHPHSWLQRWSSLVEVGCRAEKRALPRVPSAAVSQLVALSDIPDEKCSCQALGLGSQSPTPQTPNIPCPALPVQHPTAAPASSGGDKSTKCPQAGFGLLSTA